MSDPRRLQFAAPTFYALIQAGFDAYTAGMAAFAAEAGSSGAEYVGFEAVAGQDQYLRADHPKGVMRIEPPGQRRRVFGAREGYARPLADEADAPAGTRLHVGYKHPHPAAPATKTPVEVLGFMLVEPDMFGKAIAF